MDSTYTNHISNLSYEAERKPKDASNAYDHPKTPNR
jgi:hypothetical protein